MIDLHAMEKNEESFEFAFQSKKAALGPYVTEKWGWDEALQRGIHSERWLEKKFFRILASGVAVGTVSVDEFEDHVRLGEFYIRPEHQNQGIGTGVLTYIIGTADRRGLPVRLEHLKCNPVGKLYTRHGFKQTHEDETHVFMQRQPSKPAT